MRGEPVSQNAVERTLGKLATDDEFRARFFENPAVATWEAGLPLSPVELEALSGLSQAAVVRFSQSLDGRTRRQGRLELCRHASGGRRRSARRGHGLVWHRTLARRPGSESARSGPTPTEGLDRSHRARIPRA